jgi:hypothetical protein
MNGPQIVDFSDAISKVYNPDDFISALLAIDKIFTAFAPAGVRFPDQVVQVVASANTGGWVEDLLAQVDKDRGSTLLMRKFLVKYPELKSVVEEGITHPCDALFLLGGKAFVGRGPFRDFIKRMEEANEFKVLLVSSEQRRVGKSYSTELIRYFAAQSSERGAVYCDLDTSDYDPGQLAAELARGFGIAGAPPQSSSQQAARWNQELVDWLIPASTNVGVKVWWLVLDGFRTRLPSEETRDFIEQLTRRVQIKANYRLVLVNYGYELPLELGAFAFRERVERVTRADLEAFVDKLHRYKHGMPPTPDQVTSYVNAVYERLAQYEQRYPQQAQDSLLLNMAVIDARRII